MESESAEEESQCLLTRARQAHSIAEQKQAGCLGCFATEFLSDDFVFDLAETDFQFPTTDGFIFHFADPPVCWLLFVLQEATASSIGEGLSAYPSRLGRGSMQRIRTSPAPVGGFE